MIVQSFVLFNKLDLVSLLFGLVNSFTPKLISLPPPRLHSWPLTILSTTQYSFDAFWIDSIFFYLGRLSKISIVGELIVVYKLN